MAGFNLDNYIPVHERIEKFYSQFNTGRITTEMLQYTSDAVVFKAAVFREKDDAEPSAVGHAYEVPGQGHINKTSAVENCETSAVGRALAMLGIEVSRGIASRAEMEKVQRMENIKAVEQPTELERLKKVVWGQAKTLKLKVEDLDALAKETFGDEYPISALNEKQLTTLSTELAKRTKEAA